MSAEKRLSRKNRSTKGKREAKDKSALSFEQSIIGIAGTNYTNFIITFRGFSVPPTFTQMLRRLTTPLSTNAEDAQREYLLRVILLVSIAITYPTTIIFTIGWQLQLLPPDMPVVLLAISLASTAGMWLTRHGRWRASRAIPILLSFCTASYVAYVYGAEVVSGTFFLITIIITTMLVRNIGPWIVTLLSLIILIGLAWLRKQHYLPPATNPNTELLGSSLAIIVIFLNLTILLHFFAASYRRALIQAHTYAHSQETANIELLEQISQREQVEQQLAASLAEKELLLKEIHHRVKNNLQIIGSLLYLQSRQTTDEAAAAALNESRSRVQSMALVHEQLYRTPSFSQIDCVQYVQSLSGHLLQTHGSRLGNVQLTLDIDPIPLTVNEAIPFGLILNELLTNALKHAFPNDRQGSISVSLKHSANGKRLLRVCDDGVGLPPETAAELASNKLTMLQSTSLGLQLVNQLTTQLGGTITVARIDGTTVTIAF